MKKKIIVGFLSFFFLGFLTSFPGTLASLATVLLLIAINVFFEFNLLVSVVFLIIVFGLGVYYSNYALSQQYSPSKDPEWVVIDEFVGMFVACLPILAEFRRESLISFAVAFGVFRFFDISKWYLIKEVEKFPKGWGIMLDDLLAGLLTWVIVIPVDLAVTAFLL